MIDHAFIILSLEQWDCSKLQNIVFAVSQAISVDERNTIEGRDFKVMDEL